MYAKIGRYAYLLLLPLVAVVFFIIQSKRARVIVLNEKDQILLVKSWFGRQEWSLPGGGVGIGEAVEDAAKRELQEETGIAGVNVEFLGEQKLGRSIAKYRGIIFKTNVSSDVKLAVSPKHRGEIIGLKWFSKDELPEPVAKLVKAYL